MQFEYCYHWEKEKTISQTYIWLPGAVLNFTDQPLVHYDVPLVKNTFVDNGDIQTAQRTFDTSHGLIHIVHSGLCLNTQCIVSRTNSGYSFSFLTNWNLSFATSITIIVTKTNSFIKIIYLIKINYPWKTWGQTDKDYWRNIFTKLYLAPHYQGHRL